MLTGFQRRECAAICPCLGLTVLGSGCDIGPMVQCFEWEKVGEEEADMSEGFGLSMPMAKPLEAMFKPRESLATLLYNLWLRMMFWYYYNENNV
ncbi:hypothetical protein DsansV1_C24g0183201 [Dioscorea sansibarensis]